MTEPRTTPHPEQLLDQVHALRARVHELEQALQATSGLASLHSAAASAPPAASLPASNPLFPYQLVFQDTSEGVAALGEQHQILYCNQRLATMLQAAYTQLLDRPFDEIVVPQHQARFSNFIAPGQPNDRIDVALVTANDRHLPVRLIKQTSPSGKSRLTPLVVAAAEQKKNEHPLEAERPLPELFRLSPVPLFLSRMDNDRILDVNDGFLQLTGYRRPQVIGKTGLEIGLWPSAAEQATVVECLQKGDSVHHFVAKLRTQRGNWRNALISASLLEREGKQFMMGMLEDVTERKREQGVVDFQAQLLANVQDAIITTNLKHNITHWNAAAEQIYGWKAERVLGKNLDRLVRSNYSHQKRAETLRLVKKAGRIFIPDTVHYRRDGTPIHIEATIVAIRDENGEIHGFAGSFRDVTERTRADEALRKSEEKFAKMFQANTTAMALTTREGVELDVNDSLLQLLGYRREDFVGRNVLELDIWPHLITAARIGTMIAAGQSVRNVEVQWRTRTGGIKNVLLSVEPIEVNRKTCLLGMATDITDRKRAELEIRALNAVLEKRVAERTAELNKTNQTLKNEIAERKSEILARAQAEQALTEAIQRLQAHTDNSPLAVIEFDSESRLTSWSGGAERMFGWSAEEVVGKRISDLHWVYEEDIEQVAAIGAEMLAGRQIRNVRTNRNYRKDGSIVQCEWYNSALLDSSGKLISVRSQVLEVTERTQAKEQIEALNHHLKQRAEELEAANKELEAFSYSISHDLRAPLASIDGFSRVLLQDHAAQLPEEGQQYLRIIRENTAAMNRLVQDLLAFSRTTRQALHKQTVSTHALVHQVLAELKDAAAGRKIDWAIGDLPPCQADPILLKQVWANLLTNALKFTRTREVARIEIGALTDKERHVHFYVRDNGVGFDNEQAGKLFGVFQRLHSEDEYEGTGVGLAIVARIVTRHGGRVWAQGQVDQGAAFYFTLE